MRPPNYSSFLPRLTVILLLVWPAVPSTVVADQDEVFGLLARHIQRQILADKQTFVVAQTCTEWFYKRQHQKPLKPKVDSIAFRLTRTARPPAEAPDCRTRYPGGLDAAREDFSRTQSLLSLSLTFYEFTLVGDRNDDQRYSTGELRDMLESFGLPFNAALTAAAHLTALQTAFDKVHNTGGMESLMTSMSMLYDKGYRLTGRDRAALNRVMG